MERLLRELRHAVRALVRAPAFSLLTLLVLALGIGANSAIFTVVDAVLLRPLPYSHSELLLRLWGRFAHRDVPLVDVSEPEVLDYQARTDLFEGVAAFASLEVNLLAGDEPERVPTAYVTASFFPVLDVEPAVGRAISAEDDKPGQAPVVLLSYGLWQRRFGSDPAVVGQALTINGHPATVLGVMPRGFDYPHGSALWSALGIDPANLSLRGQHYLTVVARRRPEVTPQKLQAALDAMAGQMAQAHPLNYPRDSGWGITAVPLLEQEVGGVRARLLLLTGAVAFVLLIACASVAVLLLARAQARERELSIRAALGAGRLHLVRQMVTESLLLALAGGGLGLAAAYWGLILTHGLAASSLPRAGEVGLDGRVIGFTFALALLTGLVLGLIPALRAGRAEIGEALKEGGKATAGTHRQAARRLLVVLEVAVAVPLLVGAGLTIKSFARLQRVDPGFQPAGRLTLELSLPRAKYPDDPHVVAFWRQLLDGLATLPGVRAAGAVSYLPLSSGISRSATITIEGQEGAALGTLPEPNLRSIDPGYLQAMGVPLLAGRQLTAADDASVPPVVLVDETLASRHWPAGSPVGKRLKMGPPDVPAPWMTIVGVTRRVKEGGLDVESRGQLYFPLAQRPDRTLYVVLDAGATDPTELARAARAEVRALDPAQPLGDVATMEQRLAGSLARPRLSMLLLAGFAALAVLLTMVGIYGVVAYTVSQRTHEIGVRMALGARRGDVLALVVRQGMAVVAAGLAAGLVLALLTVRLMSSVLFGVAALDAATFAAVLALLAAVALLAHLVPARRAAKVDPLISLRSE